MNEGDYSELWEVRALTMINHRSRSPEETFNFYGPTPYLHSKKIKIVSLKKHTQNGRGHEK